MKSTIKPTSVIQDIGSEIFVVRYSADGKFLAVACQDGGTRLYSTESHKLLYGFDMGQPNGFPITAMRFRPSIGSMYPALVTGSSDGHLKHWHVATSKMMYEIHEEDNQILALDYNPTGTRLATVGSDLNVRIYDEKTKSLLFVLNDQKQYEKPHSNRVFALKFHPDQPDILVSGGWDNTVQIWDLRTKKAEKFLFGPHICGDALDIEGDEILTGSYRSKDQLQLWDIRSTSLIRTYRLPNETVEEDEEIRACLLYACQFGKNGNSGTILASGSHANQFFVIDRQSGNVLDFFQSVKPIFSLDQFGSNYACGGGNKSVYFFERESGRS
ncbi:putative F-box and WD-40 domain protein 7 [Blattamonas nauphoetae]|uniref:F-box and WD-40 domain protein 7 n=1 Tax=Blattamonas nauphoetae TaxID=2049346 RepID=A0ABQ9XIR4_9EUKA|nr:putative F-box and WD-40 domain protein 7 [Blattamonas nauphoetae]